MLGWQLWLTLAAPQKDRAGLYGRARREVNVLVTLPFPPERFHVLAFQRYGRVSGTQDNSIEVRGVRQADLNAVARPYWVTARGAAANREDDAMKLIAMDLLRARRCCFATPGHGAER